MRNLGQCWLGVLFTFVKCQYYESPKPVKQVWSQLGFLTFRLLEAMHIASLKYMVLQGWATVTLPCCRMAQCQLSLGQHMSTFQSWVKSAITQKNRGEQKRFSKNGNKAWITDRGDYHQKLKKNLPKLYSFLLMTVAVISAYFNRCSVYKTATGFRGYE